MAVFRTISVACWVALVAWTMQARAENIFSPTVPDTAVCSTVLRFHSLGIEHWKAGDLVGAVEMFRQCEYVLKQRSLWSPPATSGKFTAEQLERHILTNSLVFSLAAIYQQMGYKNEAADYAAQARERGLIPVIQGAGLRR